MMRHMTRGASVLLLVACLVVAVISVMYPVYVIRPFRAQGARELAAALAVIRIQPAATAISAIAALAALVMYWRAQPGRWRRAMATAGAVFVCLLAVLARVNIYELMFHPAGRPSFGAASQTKLAKDEHVIAVKLDGAARAYPIRNISYHHVINDVLDNVGVAATY
jgi:hypothetical protein